MTITRIFEILIPGTLGFIVGTALGLAYWAKHRREMYSESEESVTD